MSPRWIDSVADGGAASGAFDERRREGDAVVQCVHGIRAGVHVLSGIHCSLFESANWTH